ncbi:MAG: class I SAM-dependent methyltransferase [Pelagimonas sp.]|jgi:2-polyprenyl-3-methyl-5-hydroxy-6-metoxy-1,4-benzoquinol methylase|nr:class I SAM-dependent methyltransferase [Pelagimonas sp.]
MSDKRTIEVYDQRAAEYGQVTASKGPGRILTDFIAALPTGGRVLDLGCGPGLSAGHMAVAGLAVEGWDASDKMVALAAAQVGVTVRQARFEDLTAQATYDGIWANFSLLHAPRDAMPSHLRAIHRALKPGGLFHIALKSGTGDRRDRIGRNYTYYTQTELSTLLHAAGFTLGPFETGEDMGLDGTLAPWISVTAQA